VKLEGREEDEETCNEMKENCSEIEIVVLCGEHFFISHGGGGD
jgi:hypothetical protein